MFGLDTAQTLDWESPVYTLKDYQGAQPRWCSGCGDSAILTATQRLCRDEQIPPEKTVFVSGIGCSSRFPHYMGTYGFHGLHGRALPIAEGIKIRRPDLKVFVNMGDGDCCSIGTAHWIHAIRYNMNMVAVVHDNSVYGMTKKQASPTSPQGLVTNTTPHGAWLQPLNILSTTLGVTNASFVANTVEWIPDLLYDVLKQAYHHKGLAFVRVVQRCPHFMPNFFDPLMSDPDKTLILTHENGIQIGDELAKTYKNIKEHDPSDLNAAREIVVREGLEPVGVLYRNESFPCYDELRKANRVYSMDMRKKALEREFDKFAIEPA